MICTNKAQRTISIMHYFWQILKLKFKVNNGEQIIIIVPKKTKYN
jgi:hypothetical protein